MRVLLESPTTELVDVNTVVAREAGHLRVKHGMTTWDAVHLATAVLAKVDVLIVRDGKFPTPRFVTGRQHPQDVESPAGLPFESVTPGPPRPVRLSRLGQDLVVDVGHVPDQRDVVPVPAHQPPAQHVEGDREPDVADVRGALSGQPTDVDADLAGGERGELPQFAGGGVVQVQSNADQRTCTGGGAGAVASWPRLGSDSHHSPITRCYGSHYLVLCFLL